MASELEVGKVNADALKLLDPTHGRYFDFVLDSSASYLDVSHALNLRVNGASSLATAMTIASDGQVNISNTSDPTLKLHNTTGSTNDTAAVVFGVSSGTADGPRVESKRQSDGTIDLNLFTAGATSQTNAAAAMVIDGGSNLATFSGGIAFQSATTGSGTGVGYTLDSYETGTWTPEIADATTGGNTGSASSAKGYYTRVGNAVTVNGLTTNVDTTGMTGTSAVVIRGLPFQSGSASGALNELGRAVGSCVLDKVDFDSFTRNVNPQVHAGHSYFYFHQTRDTKSDIFILVSNLTSGEADLHFSFTYFV